MTLRHRSRALLAILSAVAALPACDPSVPTEETIHVRFTGTCPSSVDEFDVRQSPDGLFVVYPQTAAKVPFPVRGDRDQAGHTFREGGWQLWGCVQGVSPCYDDFRLCTGRRLAWQLNVTCLDSHATAVCEGVLTE